MASACISSCVNDARVPVRATYANLYKWPESDAEFVRSVSSNSRRAGDLGGGYRGHPRVVDSISCRQLYLRSYPFSRKETVPEKTRKCLERVRERVVVGRGKRKGSSSPGRRRRGGGRKCTVSAALCSIFRRLLACTTKVDVIE